VLARGRVSGVTGGAALASLAVRPAGPARNTGDWHLRMPMYPSLPSLAYTVCWCMMSNTYLHDQAGN
jgi:hypothetical protein